MATVTVEVDAWEVLEDLSTSDLVRELVDRAKAGDKQAKSALGGDDLVWAVERARDALRAGRPEEALKALTDGVEPPRPAGIMRDAWKEVLEHRHPFLRPGRAS